MAQTKKKRRTKHRGNAAGGIEVRGRTGRPPSDEERKKEARASAREKRLSKPPTWKSSFTRAGFAAVLMFLFLLLTTKGPNRVEAALIFGLFAMILYIPAGYYFERYMWQRRQRKKAQGR